ncbi:putative 2-dehydro-3-deoxy-D-pentonate aldolase YjhH [bioreactor metagenome]|uniref:Putative 2-dehydro-3-deoxy-D-pentonate aldolase YjhH n=1 Tax=bioreactor metagenome TaxID=1076179 RepID=A0A644VC76_9ZZZZ|nr:dihydrodipicolinate synthase family protein [Acidaminococcaceae bacterium]
MKKANIYTPVVTAFDKEGNLDIQANKNIYDHLINGGVDGIVVMGSTGEFFSMTTGQKKELIDLVTSYAGKRTKILIGTSCMRVDDTVELANYALNAGADAVMIIGPYYFALSDASVEAFYSEVAQQINGDIYLYNFPDRTGYDLKPQVVLNLLKKYKNIVGFKDTVTEMCHTRELMTIIHKEYPNFIVLSGFDENLAHNVLCGGDGCIGGLSNLCPEIFREWIKAIDNKDMEKIAKYQKIIDRAMDLYDIGTPFIPIIKKAMMIRGVQMKDYCTKPFLPATDAETEKIKIILKDINLL